MADTVTDTRPTFSRLTEGRASRSWLRAIPIVVILVAIVALLFYLASNISSSSQRALAAERDANQYREQITSMTKQVGDLQKEVTLDRSPGRTTVILQAAQPAAKKSKKAAAPASTSAWAAVTWGELPNGKSWMRVNAYGLQQNLDNKTYHVWMQPASGNPVDVGALDVDQNGSGFAMGSDLPAIDQGKSVMLTTDASGSKQPGDVVAKADLPKLQPTMQQAPAGQAQNAAQGSNPATPQNAQGGSEAAAQNAQGGQAKSGADTQRMHQGGK
jgi:cell division protein FtsB